MSLNIKPKARASSGAPSGKPWTQAFTLIELSIVLVIIGLIVGGILTGRDLIRSAELRSVISDVEKFKTAVNTFRGKYDCLPGDCANATMFFGAATNCNAGQNSPITSGTCNGNGNGLIELGPPNPAPATPAATWGHDEMMLFWQQLSLAGLVPGSFNGSSMTTSGTAATWTGSIPGVNVPASRIASAPPKVPVSQPAAAATM